MAFSNDIANPVNDTNDCIIRSVAKAFNEDWQSVMRKFCDVAIEKYLMPNNYPVAKAVLKDYPCTEIQLPQSDFISVSKLAAQKPNKKLVALTRDHAIAIVNGTWYDLYDSGNDIVESYWEVVEE